MSEITRVAEVFVELADTLIDDFDVVDFLETLTDRCVELLGADASGLMLSNQRGGLQLITATLERARMLELFELQIQEGPCLDCFQAGEAITNVDLADTEANQRWPLFTPSAVEAGFGATHALPMRLRGQVIGALNLFHDQPMKLGDKHIALGQAMADIATIGLLHQRNTHEQTLVSDQLQAALHSRVLIEQAKGVLSAQTDVSVNRAFHKMRSYARNNNLTLTDVATAVIDHSISHNDLVTT